MSGFNDAPYVSMAEREMLRVEQSSKDYDDSDRITQVAALQDEQSALTRDLNTYNAVAAAPSPEGQKLIIPNQPSNGLKPSMEEVTLFDSEGQRAVGSVVLAGAGAAAAQGAAFLLSDMADAVIVGLLGVASALPVPFGAPIAAVAAVAAVPNVMLHLILPIFSLGCVWVPTQEARRVDGCGDGYRILKDGESASLGLKIAAMSIGVLSSCAIAATDVMLYKNSYEKYGLSNPSVLGMVFFNEDGSLIFDVKKYDRELRLTADLPQVVEVITGPAPVLQKDGSYYLAEGSKVIMKGGTVDMMGGTINVLPSYNTAHSQACFTGKVVAVADPEVVGLESLGSKPELTYHARTVFKGTPKPKAAYMIRYDEKGTAQARTMDVVIDQQGRPVPESCPVR